MSRMVTRPKLVVVAALLLFAVWVWPLPSFDAPPFSAHMTMHMTVVAIAAPLLALGLAGGPFDPVLRAPALFAAIPASMVELVAVWSWHVPALHHAARHDPLAFALEQSTFLFAGFFLWAAAFGGAEDLRRRRAPAGVLGLLLTAMHMTLLGALLALSSRPLYAHPTGAGALSPLLDQQLGGAIMLIAGGAAYLAGGLALTRDALRWRVERERP